MMIKSRFSKLCSIRLVIQLGFGQMNKLFDKTETQLLYKLGRCIIFNNMIDALILMPKNGYDFVDSYSTTMDG